MVLQTDNWVHRARHIGAGDLLRELHAVDEGLFLHCRRVGQLSACIAEELGLPRADRGTVLEAGLFHDIGKIAVPVEILHKRGALTASERIVIQYHVEETQYLVEKAGLVHILRAAREHHEALDGSGYPNGLTGPEISLHGRVIAVADCFDAMTEDRPYRRAFSTPAALLEMAPLVGSRYDPTVFGALKAVSERVALDRLASAPAKQPLTSLRHFVTGVGPLRASLAS